jgi:hypothetical protein
MSSSLIDRPDIDPSLDPSIDGFGARARPRQRPARLGAGILAGRTRNDKVAADEVSPSYLICPASTDRWIDGVAADDRMIGPRVDDDLVRQVRESTSRTTTFAT